MLPMLTKKTFFFFQILCWRPILPVRQQDPLRVRLRGADGLRQPRLQLLQPRPDQAERPLHGRREWPRERERPGKSGGKRRAHVFHEGKITKTESRTEAESLGVISRSSYFVLSSRASNRADRRS